MPTTSAITLTSGLRLGAFEKAQRVIGDAPLYAAITGSGGMLLAQWLDLEFVQEVIASKRAVEALIPKTDVAIELGGEDAKIIYFDNGIEQRMNGTCAGGTGAFIDQMASLLKTDATGLNDLAKDAKQIYPIASRCGVFANRCAASVKRGCGARRRWRPSLRPSQTRRSRSCLQAIPSADTLPSLAVLCNTF